MDINATVGLLQLAAVMSEDVLAAAKIQEAMGLQNSKILLSQLSSFQIILDDVYKTSRPSSNDYANRGDLIRIFNEIAKEIYGNNGQCPVVEIFGSFVMDMFNAKSDLDMSINFSDKSFESDRVAKRKILRKFAKKFYALRKKGHVTTVELILSARVPVLKVTDSGSGIECDLSVGNRDGIAKSHIVRLISTIDERFQKLSFMMKAWAKAHDINSSKDGTLNSLSLILLAAFHLQTRDIPILPPFSYIFKGGMDPATVELCLPGFLNYGKKNKESLAELFVSLLVKLQSVETLWPRGLCASTYEGTWICRNPKATEYLSIEDFTDRTQNTARAVQSAQVNKIYSCIHHSVEHIRSFTAGIIDAKQLKNLLFGRVPPITSKVCPSPTPGKKLLTQKSSTERIGPGEQGKHGHNICHVEVPTSSKASGVKILKSRAEKSIDPQNSAHLTSFQGSDNTQQESLTPNHSNVKKKCPTQGGPADGQRPGKQSKLSHNSCNTETSNPSHKNTKCPTQMGPAEGQRPVKQGKRSYNPCSMETPTPTKTKKVKKKKSKIGRKTNRVASNTPTSVQGSDKLQKILTENPSQKVKKLPGQGCLEKGQRPGRPGKKSHNPGSNEASTASRRNKLKKSGDEKKFGPVTSDTRQPLPVLSISGSGGYSSLGADIVAWNNATQTLHRGPLYNSLPNQGSGGIRPLSTPHVRNLNQAASSSAANERPYLSNLANEQCQGYRPQNMHADTLSLVAPRFPEGHPPYFSNPQSSGGFAPNRTHVETWRHAAPNFPKREILSASRSAVPSFPSDRPVSHSDYQHSQGYGGFRSERYHAESLRYTPAAPWVSDSNQRVQVPGELSPGMHFETSSYSVSRRYSPSLANVIAGVGPERNAELISHATPSFQTPSYTLSSRPSTLMPPQQPYIPTGFQRSHDYLQSYPVVPSQFAPNMHPYRS